MRRFFFLFSVTVLMALFLAGGPGWAAEDGRLTKNGVTVVVTVEPGPAGTATLVGVFTPDPAHAEPLHLYGLTLPADGAGIATKVSLPEDSPLTVNGPLTADQPTHELAGLTVFAPGPVTLRLPVKLPVRAETAGSQEIRATVLVDYLACTAESCLIPVMRGKINVLVPTVVGVVAPATTVSSAPSVSADTLRAVISEELERRLPKPDSGIAWRTPRTVAEVEALLAEATRTGTPALLDFTGPSCLNCQVMEKTVFRQREVRQALSRLMAIKVDTDPPNDELAAWQQQRFHSQNRPLYVLLTGGREPKEQRWSKVFSPSDQPAMTLFLGFLSGGSGADGAGSGGFWLLALLGGLVTLLMPCTYPMIPFTVNFFAKQAAAGKKLLPLALFYGAGIVVCFVGLGVLITGVFGANLATVAGHPLTNLIIALAFVLFGMSLLGVFLLQLPMLGGSRGGYLGALLMGLTFAVTAFSCTAPFAGSVLASAVATGTWLTAVAGMTVYSLAIAVPFVALALSPGVLKKMPKAGAWMNELKVVGGLIEVAAALKFLVIADHAWGWGVFGRTVTLICWSVIAVAIAAYLLGWIRWDGDDRIEHVGPGRLFIALAFAGLGLFFAAGLTGLSLGAFEGLFPGDG